MYDNVASLYTAVETQDKYGNIKETYTEREVYVKPRSVYSNDFYNAATSGLKPELVLEISTPEDYKGELIAKYEGTFYEVIRAYQRPEKDTVELTLQNRIADNGRI